MEKFCVSIGVGKRLFTATTEALNKFLAMQKAEVETKKKYPGEKITVYGANIFVDPNSPEKGFNDIMETLFSK